MSAKIWDELDYEKNAVIEASAGTGKTYTLEQIVKKLVAEKGYDIRNILLVTFTDKAAGELKERIRAMLNGQKGAEHLDEATICTIHSFCREVLSDYPFESGMPMGMEIGGSDDGLYGQAVHNVLASKEFKSAYNDKFARRMEYWNAAGDAEGVAAAAVKALKEIVSGVQCIKAWTDELADAREKAAHLEETIRSLPGWESGGPGANVMAHTDNGNTFRKRRNWNDAHIRFFSQLDAFLKVVMDAESSPALTMEALDFIASGNVSFELHQWDGVNVDTPFCEIAGFAPFAQMKELAALKARSLREEILLEIVQRAYPEFLRLKARSSVVTFDDLIEQTARLVEAATVDGADDGLQRFVKRMRDRYQLALVDEFQDTDAKQWTIFKNLFARVGRLIVVGDPKQAIYKFRGADLETYLRAKKELLDEGGQFKSLDTMYRSTRELVGDFNTMFKSGWFAGMEEGGLSIDYSDVNFPVENIPEKVKDFVYPAGEHSVEWLESAAGLDQFAINAADEMIRLHRTWGEKMDWGDMCVLVRSHDDGFLMQRHMVKKGIPCRIYKEPGAFASVESESIVALFDYLSLPRSLGNLSALLLTPLFGYAPETIDARLENGDGRFDRLCERWRCYAENHEWIRLFESVLKETGARFEPAGYRQVLDYLLENNARAASLAEFSAVLRGLKRGDLDAGENGNIKNKAHEGSAVQIMTMHASKGLEFNAVFVAGGFSGSATDGETKRLFYVALTRAGFKLYLPWSQNFADGVVKKGSALKGYLKDAIQAVCGADAMSCFRDPGDQGCVQMSDPVEDGCIELPPQVGMKGWKFKWDSFSSMVHHAAKKTVVVDGVEVKNDEDEDNKPTPRKSLLAKGAHSGTAFHELMETLCANDGRGANVGFEIGREDDFDQIVREENDQKSPLLELARKRLSANGIVNHLGADGSDSTARTLARMVWNALRTPLDFGDGEFRLCDIEKKDRKAEVGFVLDEELLLTNGQKREGALNGSIDLLIRHGENYYIVDWKTNALESYDDASVETAMNEANYHWQYKIYALAAEKWLGEGVVKGAAYLFVRGGEFEQNPSGRFMHQISDQERVDFRQKLTDRIVAVPDEDDEEEI